MNAVDLILGAVFVFAVYDGVRRGFITSSLSLIVWSLAFLVTVTLTRLLFGIYADLGYETGGIFRLLTFSFVLVVAAGWLVVGGRRLSAALRARIAPRATIAFAERWLGILPSLLRTAIVAAVLLTAMNVFPVWPPMRDLASGSIATQILVGAVESLEPQLATILGTGERPLFLSVIHGSEEQELRIPDGVEASVDPAGEDALYALLSEERARAGLAPLERDPLLRGVARAHAREMFDLRYLSHYSPRTGKPSDRLVTRNIPFEFMGENVAYAPTPSLAHQGFLRSTSHRANLLDPRFVRVGIGAVAAGVHGTLYVQVFTGP